MVKTRFTKKPEEEQDPQLNKIHKRQIAQKVKRRLAGLKIEKKRAVLLAHIKKILKQQIFECSICLQTLLRPVLTQCGHIYCLDCVQELARCGYACGICKQVVPHFQLKVHEQTQVLVNLYLEKCSQEELQLYKEREARFEVKETIRKIDEMIVGDYIDFWCTDQKRWKDEFIVSMSNETITLSNNIKVSKSSRRIAQFNTFTSELYLV